MGAWLLPLLIFGAPLLGLAGIVSALAYIGRSTPRTSRRSYRLIPLGLWLIPIALLVVFLVTPTVYDRSTSPGSWPPWRIVYTTLQKTILCAMFVAPLVIGLLLRNRMDEGRRAFHAIGPAFLGLALGVSSLYLAELGSFL